METTIQIPDGLRGCFSGQEGREWFGDIMRFAEGRPIKEFASLQQCLEQIARIASNCPKGGGILPPRIYKDFAPMSFGWSAGVLVGGCIYHGEHDNGGDGGAPTFSVQLTPTYGWAIHT